MKHSLKIITGILLLIILSTIIIFLNTSVDLRPELIKGGSTPETRQKGKILLQQMETAYGSRQTWDTLQTGIFVQKADWYGRVSISHWDTMPQLYRMEAELGNENAKMELLNGPRKGDIFSLKDGNVLYKKKGNSDWISDEEKEFAEKILYKTYWFQFPFRIGEAQITSFAGTETIQGQAYNLLFATWGTEEPNREFDHFVLYLNQETHLIEYLHFTVREKVSIIDLTAKFTDFRHVDGLIMPFSQFVSSGKPGSNGFKLHENHYLEMGFSK